MAREFLLNDREPMLQYYYDYMVDIAIIFGANVTTAPYELLDVLNFERALANVRIPSNDFKTLLKNFPMSQFLFLERLFF